MSTKSRALRPRPRVGRNQGVEYAAAALVDHHFYACIVWAVGYWIVYPHGRWFQVYLRRAALFFARGCWRRTGQSRKNTRREDGDAWRGFAGGYREGPCTAGARARAGKAVFGDNCAPCHGSGAAGAKGYPNLNDDDWLWGGSLDQIKQTIEFGARSGHPKTLKARCSLLARKNPQDAEIVTVANYVRSLSGLPTRQGFDAVAGRKLFVDNCASCHGDAGKGNQEVGAPNLTDKIWLYGSDEATIIETITYGRTGVMPHGPVVWTVHHQGNGRLRSFARRGQ